MANGNEVGNEIARVVLPQSVTISGFISWMIKEFESHFPTERVIRSGYDPILVNEALVFNNYACRFELERETKNYTSIVIQTYLRPEVIGLEMFQSGFIPGYAIDTAHIEISTNKKGDVKLRFFIVDHVSLEWLKDFFVATIQEWPETKIMSGRWILGDLELDKDSPKLDNQESENSINEDWSKEPTSNKKEDWFKHRLWCIKNGARPPTFKFMAERCNLTMRYFQGLYEQWEAENDSIK